MMTSSVFGLTVVIMTLVSEVFGLKCLQCLSLHHPLCEKGQTASLECPKDMNAKYCLKVEAMLERGPVTMRECSANGTDEEQCFPKMTPYGYANVCTYACQTDGCNAACRHSSLLVMPFVVISVSVFRYCCL